MNARKRSFIDSLWDFFGSLRLSIITLILLALTSIIGTVIQQNRSPEEYIGLYGENAYRFFDSLQFFDMYHSWWFLALLEVFCLNIVVCSIKRFPKVWKTVREPVTVADDSLFSTLSNRKEAQTSLSAEEARRRLADFLGGRFGKPIVTEMNGKIHLFAEKGAWSRFGVYVTHLSIIVIFVGAIIGNVWGFKAYVNIVEGTSTDKVWAAGNQKPIELGFSVRCDDFDVTYYDGTRRPREFMSILDVVDGGEEVVSDRKIVVNDPLSYGGITFYQSSYGEAGDATFRVRVKVRQSGEILEFDARRGEHVPLPGGTSFAVTDYAPSFNTYGPAARLHVNAADGSHGSPFLVLQNYPDFDEKRGGAYSFSLLASEQKQYTGLQVKKDPGVWIVWTGCFLMVVGTLVAFFYSHRRLWVTIEAAGGGAAVGFGGSANRNQPAFALYFDELAEALEKELKD